MVSLHLFYFTVHKRPPTAAANISLLQVINKLVVKDTLKAKQSRTVFSL